MVNALFGIAFPISGSFIRVGGVSYHWIYWQKHWGVRIDPVKPGTTRSLTGLHILKKPGYYGQNWVFSTFILRQDYRGISFPWMSRTSVYWAITVRDPRWFSRKNLYPNFWLGTPGTSLYGQTYWGNTVLHRARMLPRCVRWDRTFLRGRAMWHKYIPHCINTCMWRTLRRLVYAKEVNV